MVANMHAVKGEKFGYRQNGLHDNWYEALQSMVVNLVEDCKKRNKKTKRGIKLLGIINTNKSILEKVESSLINFDIWPLNIFCEWKDEILHLSWIDPERCLWGDRIADFVCLDFLNMSLDQKREIISMYNQASEVPIEIGTEEKIRFAIMLGYLGLIMEAEKYDRYTFFHFGYWRNVFVSRMLFSNCFKQLIGISF